MPKAKVLVSNRSEIACRIFQACREMNLPTVGIVAPGDEEARHLTYADEVQKVSGYLDVESIVQAAEKSGSTLIHPGYGFLSERPAFAQAVEKAGLTFIGPRAETMELMGGKIAAKDLASREKVPTLPWQRVERGADIKLAAKKVGFPLLLKASAGGGGKGMRRVDREADLLENAESASSEALAAFGDGTLFLERLVDRPRHIEVQVFGDGQGGGIHLHERECSLQRRHQKVWEEATAPHLLDKTREGLFLAAMNLVRATRYRNAGTIEFLVDEAGDFFFLEMNTRLQVEHPVTELVTGVDLVCAQIQQAQQPQETFFKESPSVRGHAIEVRLYAEDPAQGFIPTPGKVEKLRWPTGAGIRIESGIEEGQTVGTQFDSMLGKLIVYAPTREHALKRLRFALEETVILGMGTNQNYLRSLLNHPRVIEGKVDTGFLGAEFGKFAPSLSAEDLDLIFAAKTAGLGQTQSGFSGGAESARSPSPWTAFRSKN
jgi:acetyl/propionyl-CoA carboxylase alpha subunit